MTDGEINYGTYSDLELGQALSTIDREAFPLNYRNLKAVIEARARGAQHSSANLQDAPEASSEIAPEILAFEELIIRLTPRTPVTFVLIAINVAIFAAMTLAGVSVIAPDGKMHVAWGSNLVPLTVDGEWWRLGSSVFLHFGLIHLLVNMWVLYSNGRMVERMFGSTRFLVLYLVAGLCGSLASAAWNPAVNSAGASGAIFGVLGGLGSFLVAKRCRVPREVVRAQSKSVGAFVLFNVINGLAHQGIDNAAHLGGLVGGFVVGLALARPMTVEAREVPDERYVINVIGAATCCLVVLAVLVGFVRSEHSAENRFMAAAVWFENREPDVLSRYNAAIELSHAGNLSDAELADRVNAEVLAFYSEANRRLAWKPQVAGPFDEIRQKLGRYVDLRTRSQSTLVEALKTGNPEMVELAMQLQRDADLVVSEFNAETEASAAAANPK